MKSSYYNDSPVFSQPQQVQQKPGEVPNTGRAGARRKTKVFIRDIGYPVDQHVYPLTTFYPFRDKQQAVLWDSIRNKSQDTSGIFFSNIPEHNGELPSNIPPVIAAKSLVLVHPVVELLHPHPIKLYVPIPGSKVSFTLVYVRRKVEDPANVEVKFQANVPNEYFVNYCNFVANQQLVKYSRFKSAASQVSHREGTDIPPADQLNTTELVPFSNNGNRLVTYPTSVAISQPDIHGPHFEQQLVARMQNVQESYRTQPYKQQQHYQIHNPLPRLPAIAHPPPMIPKIPHSTPLQSQSPSKTAFQKGKVALCNNCGVYSDNLQTCSRCGKSTMGSAISEHEAKTKSRPNSKKRNLDGTDARNEVVDLSSDENEDSQEAINPSAFTVESMHLRTSLLRSSENGKDSGIEKTTPENVIEKLRDVANKSSGSAMFALAPCSYVRIGTYVVFSTESLCIRITIAEVGLYLQLPAYKTGETKEIGIPNHQILTLYSYTKRNKFYVKIQTGPKFARWIRGALKMDEDQNGLCYFCPMHGDETRHQLMIMFSDFDAYKYGVLHRLYKEKHKPLGEVPEDEGDPDSETEGALVRVEWKDDGLVSTDTVTSKGIVAEIPKAVVTATGSLTPRARSVVDSPMVKLNNDAETAGTPLPRAVPVRMKSEPVDPTRKLFHYPFVPVDSDSSVYTDPSITLTFGDIKCLGDTEYLNDQVIDFWMRHLVDQLSPEQKEKTYVFNTFFYKRLTTKPNNKRKSLNHFEFDSKLTLAEKRHCRVKNWTKKVDIFEKDFLFIPINENAHWFLAVICFPGMVPLSTATTTGRSKVKTPQKKPHPSTPTSTPAGADKNGDNTTGNEAATNDDSEKDEETTETSETQTTNTEPAPTPTPKRAASTLHLLDIKKPCIILFDSLGEPHYNVYSTLRDYLQIEHNIRKGPDIKAFNRFVMAGIMPIAPVQINGWDCGLFVLSYTEAFFQNPITNFTGVKTMKTRKWFTEEEPANKRQEVYDFIVEYVKTYFPENFHFIPERSVVDPATLEGS